MCRYYVIAASLVVAGCTDAVVDPTGTSLTQVDKATGVSDLEASGFASATNRSPDRDAEPPRGGSDTTSPEGIGPPPVSYTHLTLPTKA